MGMRSGALDLYNNKKVHRDTVVKGLWDNAKKGGKFAGRAAGAAFWAYTAYELVSPWVRRGGWLWNPEKGEWERASGDDMFVVLMVNEKNSMPYGGFNPDSLKDWCAKSPTLPIVNGGRNCQVVGYYPKSEVSSAMKSACQSHSFERFNHATREYERISADSVGGHGVCYNTPKNTNGTVAVKSIKFSGKESMSYDQFHDLVKDPIVGVPDDAVNATRPYKAGPIPGLSGDGIFKGCLLYTSPSPRDRTRSRMPSSA